jgi:autotransporter-associated beta strand protein
VLDVTNVNIGFRAGVATATNILTNRVNISGGAVTFGDGAGAGTGVKVGSSTYNQAGVASTIGELNISGGTVLINNSTALAAAVQLGDNASAGGGTVTASMNLTGGTTTLGGHIIRSASSLRTTSTVTLDGAGAILDMDGNNIGSASALITFNAQAGTLRNLAQLNGGGVLTKSTAGVLLLDTANSFTGGLTIAANGGTVIAGHNNALGTGTVTLGGNAAQLTLVDGITVANTLFLTNSGGLQARTLRLQTGATSATYAGPISNSSSSTTTPSLTFSAEASGTLIISGIISGLSGRGVSKTGAGTVSLTGANSYTGSTTITTGTLTAATGSLAGTSGIIVNGAVLSAVNYNLAATLALNASATATISAADLNVSGAVTNANATDANALNFSASTGTITLASLAGAGKTTFGSAATITGGISVGVVNVTGLLTAAVTGGTVNAGSMTGAVSSSVTVSGLLTGAITAGTNALGSLSSTSVTGGTNTITGAATVALVNGGTTTVGGVAAITTLTTGTLNLNGATSSIGTLTAGTVNLGTTALTVNDGTFGGLLAGATGSLIKASSGTLTLSAANTYGGGTTVNLGTLIVGNAGALGTGAVTVNGGTLDLNTTNIAQVTNVITVTSGSVIGGTTTASVNTAGSPPAVTAVLTGAGGLTKTDAGTLTITTANFHTGATVANVAGAVIRASHLSDTSSSLGASALDVPANLVLGLGAKLEFTGGTATSTTRSFTVGGTAGIVAGTGAGTLEFTSASKLATTGDNPELTLTANNAAAGSNRFDGILASGSNPLAVLAIDGTGTWVIGGNANRFKGDIRIDAGAGATLGFESGSLGMGSGYTSSVIRLNNNTVLVWSGANTDDISSRIQIPTGAIAKMNLGSNNVEFASAPKDATGAALTAGTIQKSGTGTLKIATAVSSPGLDFDVPAGKLTINGSVGNVTLAAGSTLGGEGTVGAVTAASGSIISPGNSPGILFAESMTLAGPSTFLWEVQDALAGPGVGGYDKMVISGSLDLTGASAGNKITLKINSLTADGVTIGNATNFGPPNGNSSLRTFQFASVQTGANGVSLGNGLNISDVFQFDVTDFRYTGGGLSNASLWSIDWNSGTGAITLTAVPEPSTYGFGLGALALAAAAIRRRRKTQAKA